MRPEKPAVLALLDVVARRRTQLDAVEAVALSAAVTAFAAWIGSAFLPGAGAVAAGAALGALAGVTLFLARAPRRMTRATARDIERLRPESRNVVVTAEELRRHPDRASTWIAARVSDDAARAVHGLAVTEVAPARRTLAVVAGALTICVATWLSPGPRETTEMVGQVARSAGDAVGGNHTGRLTVTVQPPTYSALPQRTLTDPDRLEVLEGTQLRFAIARGGAARLRFGASSLGDLSVTTVETVARDSGYFAIEQDGVSVRLIALAVTRDSSPSVKIEQPARDLLLPNATRSIPIRVSASDDLGLASLELQYTKVSGSGEQFEFQEGGLPLRVSRGSSREWRADAEMALTPLNLEPGDSLVYRAVARDGRPGDVGLAASDTYFVEIAGPGQVPLEGVEMPPENERYALSQQMIVLKIERLIARQASMPRDAVTEESALLAAEQRSVRANFIFLLGGHVEDEEIEAEQSSEIAEGRLQNTARRDINAAIGHMTRAEQGLVAINAPRALPPARDAVEALQRAFGRSRYLLRSLASRSRLDPTRRLTGDVAGAAPWRRVIGDSEPRDGEQVRALLADLIAAHNRVARGHASTVDLNNLSERALAIDAADPRWQQVVRQIQSAQQQGHAEAAQVLEGVITDIAGLAGSGLVPRAGVLTPRSPLERAWAAGGSR